MVVLLLSILVVVPLLFDIGIRFGAGAGVVNHGGVTGAARCWHTFGARASLAAFAFASVLLP